MDALNKTLAVKPKNKILGLIFEYLLITIGLLLYVVGWSVFILPNKLVGGGVTGISSIVYYATGFNISYTYFIINVVLLAFALKFLGKSFGIKTVFAILMASFLLKIVPGLISQDFIQAIALDNGRLVSIIFGGILAGAGIGITFAQGGSTGGTDIIALIINKYYNISPGKVIMFVDVLIILSSLMIPNDSTIGEKCAVVLYGFFMVGITSYTLDALLSGRRHSVQIMIFSQKSNQIADRILLEMHRGVTVFNSKGWYSKEEKEVLIVTARSYETAILYRIVREEDKNAFITVGELQGVYGKGFESLK